MKSKLAAVLLASATLGAGPAIFAPPASALAQVEVSFEFFRDSLSPYGEWIEVGDYGLCWRPTDVGADWAPYTDGYWSYTDAGWTWVSYEDFGAVAYHYGRWVVVEDEGWVWVPDYEWGPAWVSWRNNDDYVGWAPLPPEAHWEPDRGFSVWVDTTYDIGPSYYNFCAVEDFGAPVIREVIVERPRNFFLIGATFNITNISINRDIGVPFCGGPRFDFIRERSRRRVPTLKLVRETNITNIENNTYINKTVNKTVIRNGGGRRGLRAAVEGNQLIVPAPKVRRIDKAQAVAEMKPKRRVAANRVNRGWKGVKDENERRELKEKMAKQTEGRRPDNARAKPVDVADLKPVPEKADPNAPSPVAGRGRDRDRDRDGDKKRDGKPGEVAETQKPERPDREDRPGNGKRAEKDRKDKRDKEEPAGVAGRGPLKPFNGAEREERKDQRKGEEASPGRVPAPMVTETPDADREGKRKQAAAEDKNREERQSKAKRASEDAQRQAAERQRQKMYSDEADRLKKRERNENAARQEDNNRQREAAAKQQQEAAAARRQEAAQQEQRQQRRQQQMQQAESPQRRQERAVQEDRQQRMQQLQRQQAGRQQEQRAIQQQRQGQAERQMQMQRQAERQQQQRMQQQQQRQPQRQQFQQQRPQQQQQPQQFRRQGGGGGGEARGGGGGGRNRGMSPEEAAERRGR